MPSLLRRRNVWSRRSDRCNNIITAAQCFCALIKLRAAAPADVKHLRRGNIVRSAADRVLRVVVQISEGRKFFALLLIGERIVIFD